MFSDQYNGDFMTKIWGPPMWISLHTITFYYPTHPTNEIKLKYRSFFKNLGYILPCSHCKESYCEFIKKGVTKLDETVFENRESLTKWLYCVHEAVNKKLGVDYGVSYDDIVKKYESFRTVCYQSENEVKGCDAPIDKKMESYKKAYTKECPIIPIKMAKHFIKYGRMRGIDESNFYIINNSENISENICKNTKLWTQRNKECTEIIKKMRENGVKSLESEGEWKDLPTVEELKLIVRLSSNLSKEKLINIIKKLPLCKCEYKKIYKLSR
jgi:hypothetical protein